MALLEVKEKFLAQTSEKWRVRFYYDSFSRASLNLWQNKEDGKIVRFQFSHKEYIFEMKEDGTLRFGSLDEGENPMGVKRSPLMLLSDTVNKAVLQAAIAYLNQQPLTSELKQVLEIFERELKA